VLRDPELLLEDILECAEKISRYTLDVSKNEFEADTMIQDAVIRNLEIIGEAVNKIPSEFRKRHSDLPWREIAALRNILAHAYFGLDLEIIWNLATKETPDLGKKIRAILETESF
jgi:uncharacterized protein with HEPN domain